MVLCYGPIYAPQAVRSSALVLMDCRYAFSIQGTILGSYTANGTTPHTFTAYLAICSGCEGLAAAPVTVLEFASGFFWLQIDARCVCSCMTLLTLLTLANPDVFKMLAYLG